MFMCIFILEEDLACIYISFSWCQLYNGHWKTSMRRADKSLDVRLNCASLQHVNCKRMFLNRKIRLHLYRLTSGLSQICNTKLLKSNSIWHRKSCFGNFPSFLLSFQLSMYRMRGAVNHLIVAQNKTVHHVDYKETESCIVFHSK